MPLPPFQLAATTDVLDAESILRHLEFYAPGLPQNRYDLTLARANLSPELTDAARLLLGTEPVNPFPVCDALVSSRVRYLTVAEAHACEIYAEALAEQAISQWTLAVHHSVMLAWRAGSVHVLPQNRHAFLATCNADAQLMDNRRTLEQTFFDAAGMSRRDLLAQGPDFSLEVRDNDDVVVRTQWPADIVPFPFSPALDDDTGEVIDPVQWETDGGRPVGRVYGLERRVRRHFRRRTRRPHTVVWTPDFMRFIAERHNPDNPDEYELMTCEFQDAVRRQAAIYLPESREGLAHVATDPDHPCRLAAEEILTLPESVTIFPLETWAREAVSDTDGILEAITDMGQLAALLDYFDFVSRNRLPRWYHYLNLYVHKLAAGVPPGKLSADRQALADLAVHSGDDTAARAIQEGPDFTLSDPDLELHTAPVCHDPNGGRLWPYLPPETAKETAGPPFVFHLFWPAEDLGLDRRPPPGDT